jgi:hypothetical protein
MCTPSVVGVTPTIVIVTPSVVGVHLSKFEELKLFKEDHLGIPGAISTNNQREPDKAGNFYFLITFCRNVISSSDLSSRR